MRKLTILTLLIILCGTGILHASEFVENRGTYSNKMIEFTMVECSVYNIHEGEYLQNEWIEIQLSSQEGYTLKGPVHIIIENKKYPLPASGANKKGEYKTTEVVKLDLNDVGYINTFTLTYYIISKGRKKPLLQTKHLVIKAHDLELDKDGNIILTIDKEGGFTIVEAESVEAE